MELSLNLEIPKFPIQIKYPEKILLTGSCFTEHISGRLAQHKIETLANPNGILFNPMSVAESLDSYVNEKQYAADDLFYLNEIWNSWDHHTRFSDIDKSVALEKIKASQKTASEFIRDVDWIIITLGSAFQYYIKENGKAVANNHRAAANLFEKELLPIDLIVKSLAESLERIKAINPKAKFIFTLSPVRHIRDGIIENNRSKARLLEATHSLCEHFTNAFYFPAYELLIDVLRDYRFYDIDFVHPNYLATQIVWERFVKSCIDAESANIMAQIQDINMARAHKTRFPATSAHSQFKEKYFKKIEELKTKYPFLNLEDEYAYFKD